LLSVDVQWRSANSSPFQFRSPHPGFHALDDEISFEFRNRSDDDNYCSAKWTISVDVLAEADELDAKMIQFIEHLEKVPDASCYTVESHDQNDIEFSASSIGHRRIESWPFRFRAGNHVVVFMHDFKAALFGHLAQIVKLGFRMLVGVPSQLEMEKAFIR